MEVPDREPYKCRSIVHNRSSSNILIWNECGMRNGNYSSKSSNLCPATMFSLG